MKSNKTLSITEIQDKYENRKKNLMMVIIMGFLSLISMLIFLFVTNSPEFVKYRIFSFSLFVLFFTIFILIGNRSPYLSTFDTIRYHLSKLIENLSNKNYKKSEYFLNKLAFNLDIFLEEIEDSFILNDVREFIQNMLFMLKYDIYPDLSNKTRTSGFLKKLEKLENAISDEDLKFLYSITSDLKDENLINGDIVLPYERPSLSKQIINTRIKNITTHPIIGFVFIYLFITSLILSGYYFSIKLSLLTFNYTLFSTLLLISVYITKEIK